MEETKRRGKLYRYQLSADASDADLQAMVDDIKRLAAEEGKSKKEDPKTKKEED